LQAVLVKTIDGKLLLVRYAVTVPKFNRSPFVNVNVKIDSAFIGETGLNRVVSGEFAVYGEYIQVEVVQFKVGVTVPY
jgi:hypothetical protein